MSDELCRMLKEEEEVRQIVSLANLRIKRVWDRIAIFKHANC